MLKLVREIKEEHYSLHPDYRKVFTKVLDYCRETVQDETLDKRRQDPGYPFTIVDPVGFPLTRLWYVVPLLHSILWRRLLSLRHYQI